jgi:hypothetical protein
MFPSISNHSRWRSDLTDTKLVSDRIHSWRRTISNKLKSRQSFPRCVITYDVLSCRPNVSVISEQIVGLDLNDFNYDLLESVTPSSEGLS